VLDSEFEQAGLLEKDVIVDDRTTSVLEKEPNFYTPTARNTKFSCDF
jgi:hypothetical protein